MLTTGVGMVATAAWCSRALAESSYDLALNFGVCGSFDPRCSARHRRACHVRPARRARRRGRRPLSDVHELQLLGENEFPFEAGLLVNRDAAAAAVAGGAARRWPASPSTPCTATRRRSRAVVDAAQSAGREHGRRGVHVRVPDSPGAVRADTRGVERRRAAQPRGLEDGRAPSRSVVRRGAASSSTTHEAVARLFAVPERLLHVRCDRASTHRPRRAGVRRHARRHRGAEPSRVCRRRSTSRS